MPTSDDVLDALIQVQHPEPGLGNVDLDLIDAAALQALRHPQDS